MAAVLDFEEENSNGGHQRQIFQFYFPTGWHIQNTGERGRIFGANFNELVIGRPGPRRPVIKAAYASRGPSGARYINVSE